MESITMQQAEQEIKALETRQLEMLPIMRTATGDALDGLEREYIENARRMLALYSGSN